MKLPHGGGAQSAIEPVRRWLVLGAGVVGLSACANLVPSPALRCEPVRWLFAGTDGKGLRALAFNACDGSLHAAGVVADVVKPRWTVSHPTLSVVYAAVDGSGSEGQVSAYAVNPSSGALTLLNSVGTGGGGATHLLLDAATQTLFVANFGGGSVASFPVRADGSLGERVSLIKATGSGPHRRQTSPHAHGVTLSPDGRFVLVPDLGADRVFIYARDAARHAILPDTSAPPRAFITPPGSGPRRVVFAASGRFAYVLCELTAEILTLRWDAAAGRLSPVQTTVLSRAGFQGARSASELLLSADGRFLYAGDRGESTLLVYRVDAATGELGLLQRVDSGGEVPWAFTLDPSGRWLLVANHRSNRIQVFRVDTGTGELGITPHGADSPGPASLGFGLV